MSGSLIVTGSTTFSNTETTINFNPQTSLLAGYNYLNFGGGSIMYRNNTDIYIGSNAKYGSAGTVVAGYTSAAGMGLLAIDGGSLYFQANATSVTAGTAYAVPTRFYISGNGNVGIGTINPSNILHVAQSNTGNIGIAIQNTNASYSSQIRFLNAAGTEKAAVTYVQSNGGMYFNVNTIDALTITSAGHFYAGDGFSNPAHRINLKVSQGTLVLTVSGYDTATNDTARFFASSGASPNSAATSLWLSRNDSTSRSINAGGTINASGADYAEYMVKSVNDTINKGDIVGVDINGKLTNIFADSISFVIKSTDPSYVGGDVWGNEEAIGKKPLKTTDQTEEEFAIINEAFEIKLEEARAKVDRISFSGQVPCNVLGANVGDYIIPIQTEDGKITGQAVTSPSFEQYQISVGKVWKIMEDGRAWIAVKIG
jgi:hypothetical protein